MLQSKPGTCIVALSVEEKPWYGFRTGANVAVDGRATIDMIGHVRNLSGNCEHYSAEYKRGKRSTQDSEEEIALRLRLPRMFGLPVHAITAVHQTYENCQYDSSYTARLRGGGLDLMTCAPIACACVVCMHMPASTPCIYLCMCADQMASTSWGMS